MLREEEEQPLSAGLAVGVGGGESARGGEGRHRVARAKQSGARGWGRGGVGRKTVWAGGIGEKTLGIHGV